MRNGSGINNALESLESDSGESSAIDDMFKNLQDAKKLQDQELKRQQDYEKEVMFKNLDLESKGLPYRITMDDQGKLNMIRIPETPRGTIAAKEVMPGWDPMLPGGGYETVEEYPTDAQGNPVYTGQDPVMMTPGTKDTLSRLTAVKKAGDRRKIVTGEMGGDLPKEIMSDVQDAVKLIEEGEDPTNVYRRLVTKSPNHVKHGSKIRAMLFPTGGAGSGSQQDFQELVEALKGS